MSKFEILTKHLGLDYKEHLTYMLEPDLFDFCEKHPEYEHTRYGETLKENNIDWGFDSMTNADVSKLDAKAIIALLVGAYRAERFYEGTLLSFEKSGSFTRWLTRLKELDK